MPIVLAIFVYLSVFKLLVEHRVYVECFNVLIRNWPFMHRSKNLFPLEKCGDPCSTQLLRSQDAAFK